MVRHRSFRFRLFTVSNIHGTKKWFNLHRRSYPNSGVNVSVWTPSYCQSQFLKLGNSARAWIRNWNDLGRERHTKKSKNQRSSRVSLTFPLWKGKGSLGAIFSVPSFGIRRASGSPRERKSLHHHSCLWNSALSYRGKTSNFPPRGWSSQEETYGNCAGRQSSAFSKNKLKKIRCKTFVTLAVLCFMGANNFQSSRIFLYLGPSEYQSIFSSA